MATITIKVGGKEVKAYEYATAPKKGHSQVPGKLDGQGFTFVCTKGKGRGTTMVYCAYFYVGSQVYYFYTDGGYLAPNSEVVTPNYKAPEAAPAAKKAPAKRAKATA